MRRPSERFRDRGDPRNPSAPESPIDPFRGAAWPAGSERRPPDPFARVDEHDVPEPPVAEVSGSLGLLPLLGIVLLVAAVSAYVGMTFVGRWTGAVTKSPAAETSVATMTQPRSAAPQVAAAPSPVPTSSAMEITTAAAAAQVPSPAPRADDAEKSSNARTANAAPLEPQHGAGRDRHRNPLRPGCALQRARRRRWAIS